MNEMIFKNPEYCLNKENSHFRRTGKPPMEGGEEHVVHGRNSRPWLACA